MATACCYLLIRPSAAKARARYKDQLAIMIKLASPDSNVCLSYVDGTRYKNQKARYRYKNQFPLNCITNLNFRKKSVTLKMLAAQHKRMYCVFSERSIMRVSCY